MKKKIGYTAFVALFLLVCLTPSVGMFFSAGAQTGGNEVLAPLPALRDKDGAVNKEYLSELTGYVEDNYFLRQRMVTAWSALNQKLLHTSIADNVLLGRGGWLYFADTLNDYTGADPLSGGDIASAARNLALMDEYCRSQGAQFLFTIAPNKNSVYPEHMPDLPVLEGVRNVEKLGAALAEEGVPFLNLAAAFASEEECLYFTQDSHWNSKGAALAADWINTALRRDGTRYFYSGTFSPQADHLSDLYAMLYPTGTWLETDQKYDGELVFEHDGNVRDATSMTIKTVGEGSGSLLMFRDSFGNLLYPYLADSFRDALFSRAAAYRLNLIAEREADCVVVELVERNIDYLLEYVPVMPAPLREEPEKIPAPSERLVLDASPSRDLEGYVLLQGTLPAPALEGAPVLLKAGGSCYEAFRMAEGAFALYLVEESLTEELSLLYTDTEGTLINVPVVM